MRPMWGALIGAALVTLPVLYFVTRPSQEQLQVAPNHSDDMRDSRIAELEATLHEVRARLDRTEAVAPQGGRPGSGSPASSAKTAHGEQASSVNKPAAAMEEQQRAKLTPEEQAAQDNAYQLEAAAALEGRMAGEDYDTVWASNFQSDLQRGLMAESFTGTRLLGVQCKSSLCRVALDHDDPDTEAQFFEHILELPVMANTQAYYQRENNADGSTSLVMYIAREGQSLPLPQRQARTMP